MRRLLVIAALAAAAFPATSATAAECTFAGHGAVEVRLCTDSGCGHDYCTITVAPSCTGVPADCSVFAFQIRL